MDKAAGRRKASGIDHEELRPYKRPRHEHEGKQKAAQSRGSEEADRDDGATVKRPSSNQSDVNTSRLYLVLHRVNCSRLKTTVEDHSNHAKTAIYHDEPRLFAKDTRGSALRGLLPVADVDTFLRGQDELSFVVHKDYDCSSYHRSIRSEFVCTAPESIDRTTFEQLNPWFHTLSEDGVVASVASEDIDIIDRELAADFDDLVSQTPEIHRCYAGRDALRFPYDFFYHFMKRLQDLLEEDAELLGGPTTDRLQTLLSYIQSTCSDSWQQADRLFESGIVSPTSFSKLFKVGDIVVHGPEEPFDTYLIEVAEEAKLGGFKLVCWHLDFDGGFFRQNRAFAIKEPEKDVDLTSLTVWPLRLDKGDLEERLKRRGEQFWLCRHKRLVSYQALQPKNFELQTGNPKFMVDIETHRLLHPEDYPERQGLNYEPVDMSSDKPPAGNFGMLLPATIPGFGFHNKKWINLQVDYIQEAAWNEQAFSRLVLKPNKRELIQALVTIHLENNKATDIIEGKGAGLIMLLHGPPGTGKTLTAETVSELAKKPLYRVTCGDIGVEAEHVEKYLESALSLGTIWDCVVLLDEADVFLEERTQSDMSRNALVSVFLRALEYFNGILILTSNRSGIFDEAFKSRMQLAIRYPPLDEDGRFKIWDNFFSALKRAGIDMEFDDLRSNLNSLARKDLNGRQIRNIIKTARQLAAYRGQRFSNQHLECAIEVVEEFEQYLVDTRGSDAYHARQQKLRYD